MACLSVRRRVCLSRLCMSVVYLSVCLSVRLCLSVCLSAVCLSVWLLLLAAGWLPAGWLPLLRCLPAAAGWPDQDRAGPDGPDRPGRTAGRTDRLAGTAGRQAGPTRQMADRTEKWDITTGSGVKKKAVGGGEAKKTRDLRPRTTTCITSLVDPTRGAARYRPPQNSVTKRATGK